MKQSIYDFTLPSLAETLSDNGFDSYRAKQVFHWLYQHFPRPIEEMSNLPKTLREFLTTNYSEALLNISQKIESPDGAVKVGFELYDSEVIESVILPQDDGRTSVCLSTQVGCRMGCKFCLTGQMGLKRQLLPHEITLQYLQLKQMVGDLNNIVFMGMGEAMDNFDNFCQALDILTEKESVGFPQKRMTVSTVGMAARLVDFARKYPQIKLAISLNTPDEERRSELMPINRKFNLAYLHEVSAKLKSIIKFPITFEYVMMADVNDTPRDARQLVKLLHGLRYKVNLIPLNEAPGLPFKRPSEKRIAEFARILAEKNVMVTVRESKGQPILAACGQLRVG